MDSIIILTRAGRRRAAFGLCRPMIEYYTRMRYYTIETEDNHAKLWRDSGGFGPANVRGTHAYRDLRNAHDKVIMYVARMPKIDYGNADEEERKKFDELLTGDYDYLIQRWARMLNTAHAEDEDRREFIDSEYGTTGAILHGDQLASYEMFMKPDGREQDGLPSFDTLISEQRAVGTAMHIAVLLMEAIGKAVGRDHAVHYFRPRLVELFHLK